MKLPINLTIEMRINLSMIIRNSPSAHGKRKNETRKLSGDLLRMVQIPEEEMPKYEVPVQGERGVVIRDMKAIKEAPYLTVELDLLRTRRLMSLIEDWDKFGPQDDQWLDDLILQLEDNEKKLCQS